MRSILPFAICFIQAVKSAPATQTALKDGPGWIYICTKAGLQGQCTTLWGGSFNPSALGSNYTTSCQQLPAPYAGSIGSARPNLGTICRLYDSAHSTCLGSGLAIMTNPGPENLYVPTDNGTVPGTASQWLSCIECDNCQGP